MANVIGEKLNEVTQMINDFRNVKDYIRLGIRPVTTDEQVQVVTRPYLDLELYCYVVIGEGMSTKVTKGLLKQWGVAEDKLFWIATDNTVPTYTMQTMLEQMMHIAPEFVQDIEIAPEDTHEMFVATTQDMHRGASILATLTGFDKVADAMESDLYILPSSIHEVLLIRADMELEALRCMVKEINDTDVHPSERLSYNVYKYLREEREVVIA